MRFLNSATLLILISASPALAGTYSPQEAGKHIGEMAAVEGVAHVHVKSSATFLDMGHDYPNQDFVAVIFPNRTRAFGDLMRYDGKVVNVTGKIREYMGGPEIILDAPDQLRGGK